jgi:hypothetical protein
MNRDQAMGTLSVAALFLGVVLISTAGTLAYAIPMSDTLTCERATAQCVVRHRTTVKARAGAVPLATITGLELKDGKRRGAERRELWLRAGADSFWVADFAKWESADAESRLAEGRRFLADANAARLEIRRDHSGGPLATMVTLALGFISLIAAWRLRMRVPPVR